MSEQKPRLNLSRRLYKSRSDRVIAGVCGGVARYFEIDTGAVRIVWSASILFGGAGLVAYVIAFLVIPDEKPAELYEDLQTEIDDVSALIDEQFGEEKPPKQNRRRLTNKGIFWGTLLTTLGIYFLLIKTGIIRFSLFFWTFPWELIIPIGMIIIGLLLIIKRPGAINTADLGLREGVGEFRRTAHDQKLILGVCGGMARYFNIDVSLVRIAWILFTFFTVAFGVLIYIVLGFLIPDDQGERLVNTESLNKYDF